MAKPALGRGLGALLGGVPPTAKPASPPVHLAEDASAVPTRESRERVERIALGSIQPCPFQPRKDFPETALNELAASIREQGIVQPLLVRKVHDHYELIAGERRWRAAQLAGLTEVPVLVREADDHAALELALIENLQREDLNPIEEAQGYQQLIERFALRQEDIASRVGRSRESVANALRLLRLAPELQAWVRNGQLSVGHAKVLLGVSLPEEQRLVAERVLRDGLSVRQTEELLARLQDRDGSSRARKIPGVPALGPQDAQRATLEHRLEERFGTKVSLRYRQGRGAIEVRFFSDEELERILALVGVTTD